LTHLAEIPNMQDTDQTLAEQQIQAAWLAYQSTDKHGLAFGRVNFDWQQTLKKQGNRRGEPGLYAMWHKVGIPPKTAYYWIDRYKESVGIITPTPSSSDNPDTPFNPEGYENTEAPSLEISLTPLNVGDTRCLSMAKERLKFVQGKMELLLAAKEDPTWDQNEIQQVLMVYYQALCDFSTFIQRGIDSLVQRGVK